MATRNFAEIATGAVVLLAAAGFLGYAVASSGRTTVTGYPLVARFDHIDGLVVGADVRMAGVKVGSVLSEEIDPQTYQAVVRLDVRDGLAVPKDSAAEVTSDGLLGGKYLSISPGGDTAMLKPGEAFNITQGSVSLEQLLGKFIFSISNKSSAAHNSDAAPAPGGGAAKP
ncbi:outer membrane lipid asymmetry maintenance protein MlaD [Acidisphaera rubrifaciens]|uniref:ABC transporter toluene tolerance protein n=1 Tax=Acidisphaera rubrifaciens HS-AP3 TaxID=1231350 RepID=A0A0D6P6Q8_9PROT|nr:outer membrane lipid asymmetry maintenance protein MlaD [Acidisphaera rubrifaciens]GAN76883.1 ABC transporter toluene tolerance protein [Acidisphaera rubrifaciens HS-AP3]